MVILFNAGSVRASIRNASPQVGLIEIGFRQVGPVKLNIMHIGPMHVGVRQVRSTQDRFGKVGLMQADSSKDSLRQGSCTAHAWPLPRITGS